MRIIVYVSQLWNLTGGEINTRDWAFGLKARGHKVIVYTPIPGTLAETVRKAGIVVVDDPALINDPPDVMFGSGVNDVVALLARFPETPAIQVCQQWDNWVSFPCMLPQIALYMAVDEINRDLRVNEFGVSPDKVRIVYNSVDLGRIPPRSQPLGDFDAPVRRGTGQLDRATRRPTRRALLRSRRRVGAHAWTATRVRQLSLAVSTIADRPHGTGLLITVVR